jgi:hypothetical protein
MNKTTFTTNRIFREYSENKYFLLAKSGNKWEVISDSLIPLIYKKYQFIKKHHGDILDEYWKNQNQNIYYIEVNKYKNYTKMPKMNEMWNKLENDFIEYYDNDLYEYHIGIPDEIDETLQKQEGEQKVASIKEYIENINKINAEIKAIKSAECIMDNDTLLCYFARFKFLQN